MEKIFVAFRGEKDKIVEMTIQEAWDRFGSKVSENSYKIETKITYDVQTSCFERVFLKNSVEDVLVNKTKSFERKELLQEIESLTESFKETIDMHIDEIRDKPLKIEVIPTKWYALFESFQGYVPLDRPITDFFLTKEEAEQAALSCFEKMLFSYENEIIIHEKGENYEIGFFINREDAEGFMMV